KPPDLLRVDVRLDAAASGGTAAPGDTAASGAAGAGAASAGDEAVRAFAATKGFRATPCRGQECLDRLRLGRTDIVVVPGPTVEYVFDPTRPESVLARTRVDEALQRSAGRADPLRTTDQPVTQPGSRYIDFLIPGLLGMNLM